VNLDSRKFFLLKFSIISAQEHFLSKFFFVYWYAMPTFVPKFEIISQKKIKFAEIIGNFSL
jgi:hypothetical protein